MQRITEEERELVDRIAQKIYERRMSVPAILFLEMSKPLCFVGSSLIAFLEPVLQSIIPYRDVEKFRSFIEKRENVEYLIEQIEKKDIKEEK